MTAFPLFEFIAPEHPFRPWVERFAAQLAQRGECVALVGADAPPKRAIHAEIKALPEGEGFRLDRFYWSGQRWDGPAGRPFRAITLEYAAKTGESAWHEFPQDSYLTTMADYFAGDAGARPVEVLRYVPLRRFTFRTADGEGRALIAKFKRRSRFRQAYALLETVARELPAAGAEFRVAAPLGIDEARCLYYQEALRGRDLAHLVDAASINTLLARIGRLHASMHALQVRGVGRWEVTGFIDDLERDLRWIAFFRLDLAGEIKRVAELLRARRPQLDSDTFCHGDFVCSQVLAADDGWSITDFDLCCMGDACRDSAMFLASLGYDVPYLEAQAHAGVAGDLARAAAAYLDGYAARSGSAPDARRLAWHRAAAEIYYLALMLKKDRYSDVAFAGGLERMREALAILR